MENYVIDQFHGLSTGNRLINLHHGRKNNPEKELKCVLHPNGIYRQFTVRKSSSFRDASNL